MQITTDGIVIKESAVGDYDRVLSVLTRDLGVIRAFSVGSRRIKSKKNASTSLLAYSRFSLSKSKDAYRVDDAAPREMFFGLRDDIVKLTVAQYLCELCLHTVPEGEPSEEYLRLVLNTFHFLCDPKSDADLLKAIAELRLMTVAGFAPDLLACRACGTYDGKRMYFDTNGSSLICADCLGTPNNSVSELDGAMLAAMRHIVYSDFEKLFSFSIPHDSAARLSRVTEKYVISVTERGYKTLDFLNSLLPHM